MKTRISHQKLSRIFVILMSLVYLFSGSVALADTQQEVYQLGVNFYDVNACTGETTQNSGGSINPDTTDANAKAQDYMNKTKGLQVGYALYDSAGDDVAHFNDTFENYGASITKAMLLIAYLNQTNGTITKGSTADTELTNMIEVSDNASANWVFDHLNSPKQEIMAVANAGGMGSQFKYSDNGDNVYRLGQSQITANAFASFFSKFDQIIDVTGSRVDHLNYAQNLLGSLSPGDQVGLLKSNLPSPVYSKEGWKPEPGTAGYNGGNPNPFGIEGADYVVNQAAQFRDNLTTYGIAVTVGGIKGASQAADEKEGESIIQDIVSTLMSSPSASSNGDTCCSSSGTAVPPGNLPSIIPEPYNGAFTQAGQKNNVAPALVAGIFTEENMTHSNPSQLPTEWKEFLNGQYGGAHSPPGASGVNQNWPTSPAGATGPFQFLPSTWTGLGYNIKDINNLVTAADGAAKYLASNGGTANKPPSSWQNAIFAYNHAQWYVDAVMSYYNYYTKGTTSTSPQPSTSTAGTTCTNTTAVNCNSKSSSTPGLSTARNNAVCIAENELSLWKSNKMSPGFRTCNDQSLNSTCTSFAKYTQNNDELWCADFVSWVYHQANYPIGSGSAWRVPAVINIAGIGQKNQQWHYHSPGGYQPKPGDLVIHDTSQHVNMVVAVNGKSITMIGGDQSGTSFPDGSSVSEYSTDSFATDGITGFVSPD